MIEINKKIKVLKNFYWFSKKDLEHLIKKKKYFKHGYDFVFSSFIKKIKKIILFKKRMKLMIGLKQEIKNII